MNKIFYIILGILFAVIISLGSVLIYRHYSDTSVQELSTDDNIDYTNETKILDDLDDNIDYTNETKVLDDNTISNNYDESYNDINNISYDSTTESNDSKMINYFSGVRDEIKGYVNSDNVQMVKEKGKEYFILICDFMFYGSDINGIYLSDVSDSTKEVLWNIFGEIDSLIVRVSPNYKEEIGTGYNKITDILKSGYDVGKNKVREVIGDNKYNKASDIYNNVVSSSKSVISSAREKVSNWYQKFREE